MNQQASIEALRRGVKCSIIHAPKREEFAVRKPWLPGQPKLQLITLTVELTETKQRISATFAIRRMHPFDRHHEDGREVWIMCAVVHDPESPLHGIVGVTSICWWAGDQLESGGLTNTTTPLAAAA